MRACNFHGDAAVAAACRGASGVGGGQRTVPPPPPPPPRRFTPRLTPSSLSLHRLRPRPQPLRRLPPPSRFPAPLPPVLPCGTVPPPRLLSVALLLQLPHPRLASRLALRLFDQMHHRGVHIDRYTLPFLIHACSSGDRPLCESLHGHSLLLGYSSILFTKTALMNAYFAWRLEVAAGRVFDEMRAKDVVAWTGMVSGYVDSGMLLRGVEVSQEMRGCDEAVRPSVATVVSIASACTGLGSLEYAKGLHAYVEKVGLEGELIVTNALIDMYGKCGGVELARGLFGLMPQKDLHSWTAIISGLASHGHGKEAVALFLSMREAGVLPDSTTFVVVLSACSHAGLVDEGISIFNSMENECKVTPDIKHYGCMLDLFSRAGLIARVY